MGVAAQSATPEQFLAMDLPEDAEYELHEGEVVRVTFPRVLHRVIQERIELPFTVGMSVRSAGVGVARTESIRSALSMVAQQPFPPMAFSRR